MSSNGALVELRSVGHRYKTAREQVLANISLSVPRSKRVAILGRTGCGKSTLLQLIAGLLHPSEGEVRIDGALVRNPSPSWNLMFQRPLLYPWLTARKNVGLGLRFNGRAREADARSAALLKQLGLENFIDAKVTELSGGQQQRVALARSLATEPRLLLLDEPFSSLDIVTRTELRKEVRDLADKLGFTLILVTHDIDEAIYMAERIVVLAPHPGRVIAEVIPAEFADEGKLRDELRAHIKGNETIETNHISSVH